MRPQRGAILITGPGTWRIGAWSGDGVAWTETDISAKANANEITEKLPAALDRAGCGGRAVVLALPSGDCLAASIATSTLPRKDRRRAMAYRLEGKLPLAIEELSADFITHNGRALGVCVQTEKFSAAVEGVRRCGVRIAAVCPAAILGLQASRPTGAAPDVVIWRTGESADIFLLDGGELVQWHWVPATAADVRLILASCALTGGRSLRLALRGACQEWSAEIGRLPNTQIIADDPVAMDDAALESAKGVLAEEIEPLVNFRHDGSVDMALRRPLIALIAACLLFCLCLIAAAVLRAGRYAERAAGFDDQQRQLFQQLYPGEAVPPSVESRLRSDAGRLERLSAGADSEPSSLTLLYNLLANLPPGRQFEFDDLQFDSGQTTVHGRAGSLAEADSIAAALRENKALQVDDPRTQQLADGGVGFTIVARERGLP